MEMKVKIIVGAEAAYACIKTETTSLDVRLNPGKGAAASLRETAQELRDQAERLMKRAVLIEMAERLL